MRIEASAWRLLRPHLLAAKLDPIRVENPVHPGTPDVNLLTCWIELKAIEAFPARASTIIRIRHYTPAQRVWLLRRWRAGGGAWLALYVKSARLWYLFDGERAQEVGRVTYGGLLRCKLDVFTSAGLAEFFADREPGFRRKVDA